MVNNVVLIGRITRELEVKQTATSEVVNFSVAVNRNFKNASGEYDADFINCVAFGQTANFMGRYLGKGQLISVTGRIQTRNYENNMGQRVYVTEVVCENVSSLERRDSTQQNNYNQQPSFDNNQNNNMGGSMSPQDFMKESEPELTKPTYAMDDIDDDELPF